MKSLMMLRIKLRFNVRVELQEDDINVLVVYENGWLEELI